jgi:hypothetical protein
MHSICSDSWRRGTTHERKVDLPTPASPIRRTVISGVIAVELMVIARCPKGARKVQGGFIFASEAVLRRVKDLDTSDNQMLGSA